MKRQGRVPAGSIGAALELRVAADLLMKGFEVFRALSPSCSCDLAILRDGKLLRVEVRAGRMTNMGRIDTQRTHSADVLAIVLPDSIVYEPNLPEPPKPIPSVPIPIQIGDREGLLYPAKTECVKISLGTKMGTIGN